MATVLQFEELGATTLVLVVPVVLYDSLTPLLVSQEVPSSVAESDREVKVLKHALFCKQRVHTALIHIVITQRVVQVYPIMVYHEITCLENNDVLITCTLGHKRVVGRGC